MPFESRDGVYSVVNDVASNIRQALGLGHVAARRRRRSGSGVKPFRGFSFRGGGEGALRRVAARPRRRRRLSGAGESGPAGRQLENSKCEPVSALRLIERQ